MITKKPKPDSKKYPTLKIKSRRDIAMDFAEKIVKKFDTLVKAVVLFGSTAKSKAGPGSDIDIIIIVDDATIIFDEKFTMWYREELAKIVSRNPYKADLHINTIKVTTWWEDLIRSDPVVINILRYGEPLIDVGGFIKPLKVLLEKGRIKPTPESIYNVVNRVPGHIVRSKISEMSAMEGCYWSYVECSQALLMAVNISPPSPEHVPALLDQHFVKKGFLNKQILLDFGEVYRLHKEIVYGKLKDLDGKTIDMYQNKSEEFFKIAVKLLDEIL